MKHTKNIKIVKILIALIVVVILGICIYKMWPTLVKISTIEGQLAFKEEISNSGFKGLLLLFSLQVLQMLLVVLPGEPFEIIAGMCYGSIGGTIFITTSVFITTTLIFFTVRKLGHKYLYNFFKKEKIDKIMKSKLLSNEQNLEIVLTLLFVIPGTPKDLLVYIGGLLPIKPLRFILISTFVRFPSVITSCMIGANITNGNWKLSILISIITFLLSILCIYIVNRRDKNKEIIDIIK